MNPVNDHCTIARELTTEERDRYLSLLRQQGIYQKEPARMGQIAERGSRNTCPHYVALTEDLQYCCSQCFLHAEALRRTEEGLGA